MEKPTNKYQELLCWVRREFEIRNLVLTEQILLEIPSKWKKFGDLVLLNKDCFQSDIWMKIEHFWQKVCAILNPNGRLGIVNRVSRSQKRIPNVNMLVGDTSVVLKTENKIKYRFDLTKCMFSSGNISEKLRISRFDCSREVVVDMFAGIGYFSLSYLVHAKADRLIACDINPDAIAALRDNLQLNGVKDRALLLLGDNREVVPPDVADRVNLGLIPSSEASWAAACRTLRRASGGMLHIHGNVGRVARAAAEGEKGVIAADPVITDEATADPVITDEATADPVITDEATADPVIATDVTADPIITDNDTADPVIATDPFRTFVPTTWAKQSSADWGDICASTDLHQQKLFLRYQQWILYVVRRFRRLFEVEIGSRWRVLVTHVAKVKSYAPHIDHVVVDLDCRPVSTGS